MRIVVKERVAVDLELLIHLTQNEFSGIGFCEMKDDDLVVYDFVHLADGSIGYTEIPPTKIFELLRREDAGNGRVWTHRHPIGNGIPGPHNWSARDEQTIREQPLGGDPNMIGWSASIVRTPFGWAGRVDNHIKKTTAHVDVCSDVFQVVNNSFCRGYNHGISLAADRLPGMLESLLADEEYELEEFDG